MAGVSILIAAHNEGELLWRTVGSCRDTCEGLDYEIVIGDDASTDNCVAQVVERFPEVHVDRWPERRGPSPTKDLAAERAVGEILVFLDGHCKPEPGAIARVVEDVRELKGDAIVTPSVAQLDPDTWTNSFGNLGHGYLVELDNAKWRWIPIGMMRPHGRFFESPSLIGCCFAVSKRLYERLWGFDRDMYMWGVEDVDFGVKSWLLGHPILHDPEPVIGHRFQNAFTKYTAPTENLLANQLRMAFRILAPAFWREWLESFRSRHAADDWHKAWDIFTMRRGSAEDERVYLWQNRVHDEVWYARRFGLKWPLTQEREILVARR